MLGGRRFGDRAALGSALFQCTERLSFYSSVSGGHRKFASSMAKMYPCSQRIFLNIWMCNLLVEAEYLYFCGINPVIYLVILDILATVYGMPVYCIAF